jgi:hypothetical protein
MTTSITIRENDKCIFLADLTDHYNGTSAYNRNTRSFKKAAAFVEANRERLENSTLYSVIDELNNYNLKMRSYCAID